MDKHKRRIIFWVALGMFLIGGVMAGRYIVEKGYYESPGTLGEIDLGDTCFLGWLPMIGRAIENYQMDNEGRNPDDLELLNEFYGLGQMICEYVYRGADLTSESPADLILVYDKAGNHAGYRNVLSVRKANFFVDGTEVSRAEYGTECVSLLMSRAAAELDIRLDGVNCLYVDENGRFLVYGGQVDAEMFQENFNQLVLEFKTGLISEERISIFVKDVEQDRWERKAWVSLNSRVQQVSEDEFVKLVEWDNEVRKGLGLAEKAIGK
ncbi:MAG: hypothetical protein GY869_12960 [Planctomycetes bacterium]|nr:hypothetical protein [Planctomycetota bacterium]